MQLLGLLSLNTNDNLLLQETVKSKHNIKIKYRQQNTEDIARILFGKEKSQDHHQEV